MPIDPSPIDPWLPMGFELAQGLSCGRALFDGPGWQIVELTGRARALLAHEALAERWTSSGLVEEAALVTPLCSADTKFCTVVNRL